MNNSDGLVLEMQFSNPKQLLLFFKENSNSLGLVIYLALNFFTNNMCHTVKSILVVITPVAQVIKKQQFNAKLIIRNHFSLSTKRLSLFIIIVTICTVEMKECIASLKQLFFSFFSLE